MKLSKFRNVEREREREKRKKQKIISFGIVFKIMTSEFDL